MLFLLDLVLVTGGDEMDETVEWSFAGSLLYSITVITTIGKEWTFTITVIAIFAKEWSFTILPLCSHFTFTSHLRSFIWFARSGN